MLPLLWILLFLFCDWCIRPLFDLRALRIQTHRYANSCFWKLYNMRKTRKKMYTPDKDGADGYVFCSFSRTWTVLSPGIANIPQSHCAVNRSALCSFRSHEIGVNYLFASISACRVRPAEKCDTGFVWRCRYSRSTISYEIFATK